MAGNTGREGNAARVDPHARFARVCGLVAAGTGVVALVGWSLGIQELSSFGRGRIPMAPSTAVLLLLYGIAATVAAHDRISRSACGLSVAIYCAGAAVALPLLVCSSQGVYWESELLGFAAGGVVEGAPVGHMSPLTAIGFLTASASALLSLSRPSEWRDVAATYLACLIVAGFAVFLLAYLYSTPSIYGGYFIPPAAPTSLAFVGLGLALLGRRYAPAPDTSRPGPILVLMFVVSATAIIAVGYVYFSSYQAQYRGEIERQLGTIAQLKVTELVQYRDERIGDGEVFLHNRPFSALVARVLSDAGHKRAREQLAVWLRKHQTHYQYDGVSLLDAQGVERMRFPEGAARLSSVVTRRAAEVLRLGQTTLQDFYRNENDHRIYLTVLVPIFHPRDRNRALGVVAFRIDPRMYLYAFIGRWPTTSATAETLLVRREANEVVYLNELRYREGTALSLRVPLEQQEVPAIKAVLGLEGFVEGIDYRGVAVVADVRAIPGSPWFLVAKLDRSEAWAPLRNRMWTTVGLVLVLLVAMGASVGAVWRQQMALHYRQKYEAQRDRAWLQDVIARSLNEIYVFDPDTLRFSFVNAGACRNIGYTAEELAELSPLDIQTEFTEAAFRAVLQPLRDREREVSMFDTVHRRKDGSEYFAEVHLQLVDSGSGRVFLAIVSDITSRRSAEVALQRQRDLYDMLAQTNQAIVRCSDRNELFGVLCRIAVDKGHFAFAWVGLLDPREGLVLPVVEYGEDAGYLSGLRVSADASDPSGRGPTGVAFRTGRSAVSNDFVNDPATMPWRESGRRAGVRASAALPLRERGKVIGTISLYAREPGLFTQDVIATLEDMANDVCVALDKFALEADRARAQQALGESEYRYRDLVENSRDLICTHDMQGKLLSVNEAGVKVTGYSRNELLRMSLRDLIDPEFQDQFDKYLAELGRSGHARGIMRIRTANGEARFWEYDNTVRSEAGSEPVVRGIGHDVTDRLNAERERRVLEVQLRAAQKMEALGTLAGGIAHDFNNILGAIIGNVELARQDVGPAHPAMESLEEIRKASRRAKDVVQRILAFSRQQPQPQRVIPLRPVIEEGISLLRAILPAGIELVAAFDPDTPAAMADPTDIHQVLINLCTNASQALDGKAGQIRIALEGVTLDEDQARASADLHPGRFARLCVSDTGSGMDAGTIERMFDPFFTTKSVGQGTGLGLSVVHGIVKAHGGAITVTSQPGQGTTFCIYLPAAGAEVHDAAIERHAPQPVASVTGQHVLYVDDEEALVFLVTRTLQRMGLRVSGYTRPHEAIAAVRAAPDQFDLVITDLNMPGCSGLEVAREIAKLRPGLPVVLASGYITDALRTEALAAGVTETIYKPNTVEELCAVVQRLAGAPRHARAGSS